MTPLHLSTPPPGRRPERQGRRPRRVALALAAVAALAGAACGGGSDDDDAGAGAGAGNGGGLTPEATTGSTAARDGGGGGTRTIEVAMEDNRFSPASVEVAAGETVTFAFTNDGTVTHDAVVGDEAAQAAHEDEMRASGSSGSGHETGTMDHGAGAAGDEAAAEDGAAGDEAAAITVEPGGAGELTHTFAAGDEVLIGCHEPGHYDAGMRIDVAVSPA